MFLLLDRPHDWVHRRVESVSFVDATSIRRRVSVDFDVPTGDLVPKSGRSLVPLALLEKRPLIDLDVCDEGGSSLPVLTSPENGFVAWSLLARVAREALTLDFGGAAVPPSILHELRTVAGGSRIEGREALGALRHGSEPKMRAVLHETDLFMGYATDLATRFLLLVEVEESDQGSRRIFKFAYTEALEPGRNEAKERLVGKLGWAATQFDVLAPAVGEGQSHHFEFTAPPGLEIVDANLFIATDDEEEEEEEGRLHEGQVVGPRAHLYAAAEPPEANAIASVWLRPPKVGLLRASLATAAITLGVFIFFSWGDRIQTVGGNAAIALLLTVPGLIGGFIVRPGEHGLATNLLVGVRATVSLSGIVAYAGAILVGGGIEGAALTIWWKALAVVAGLCLSSLAVAYFAARRRALDRGELGGEEN